jgi:hypothetical protein
MELLPFVPVRLWQEAPGLFRHPPEDWRHPVNPNDVVGIVERVWSDPDGIFAVIHFCAEAWRLRRALLAMTRDRCVSILGLSVVMIGSPDARRIFESVDHVRAVDVVTWPAGSGCVIRRPVRCSGLLDDPMPGAGIGTTGVPRPQPSGTFLAVDDRAGWARRRGMARLERGGQ